MKTEAQTSHQPAGGDGLMFLISMAVVAVVALEGLFIAYSSWWLMSAVLLFVILCAIAVSSAIVRLMEDDTPVAAPRLRHEAAAEPEPARPAPIARPRPIVH